MASYDLRGKKVWVAGHGGMVGSALVRRLADEQCRILTVPRAELDLRRQADVEAWMGRNRPDAVIIAAATVGGIAANSSRPAEFLYNNLSIATNIIQAAADGQVEKLLFLGTACMYPRLADQPIREDSLLTGPFEPTNEGYAIAKVAGLKMCQSYRRQYGKDFIAACPTNLYGIGDNFDPKASHVVPAMIAKIQTAIATGGPVEIWGTGTPRREFLYVDDAADALVFLLKEYSSEELINIGAGEDVSIMELAQAVAKIMGYKGGFDCDVSKPDGMPRKQLSAENILAMGWRPQVSLLDGLEKTISWYENAQAEAKASAAS